MSDPQGVFKMIKTWASVRPPEWPETSVGPGGPGGPWGPAGPLIDLPGGPLKHNGY